MEDVPCVLCGSPDHVMGAAIRGWRVPDTCFYVVRCRVCGLLYLNPRPTVAEMGHYYDAGYYSFGQLTRLISHQQSVHERVLRMAHHYLALARSRHTSFGPWIALAPVTWLLSQRSGAYPSPRGTGHRRLLDVGCGDGYFPWLMQQMGWVVAGLEINAAAAETARSYGVNVTAGTLDQSTWPAQSAAFDVVRFSHTLEHMHQPRAALCAAYRLLHPGGQLIVGVPNAGSLAARLCGPRWAGYDVPVHLQHYTHRTLRRQLWQAGFRGIRIGTVSLGTLAATLRLEQRHPWVGRVLSSALGRAVLFPLEVAANLVGQGDSLEAYAIKPLARVPRST